MKHWTETEMHRNRKEASQSLPETKDILQPKSVKKVVVEESMEHKAIIILQTSKYVHHFVQIWLNTVIKTSTTLYIS